MDIEKAKKDIIYFVENALGFQLQQWQKELLMRYQNGEMLYFNRYRYGKNKINS